MILAFTILSSADSIQISHARRAWVPPLLKYGAMLSGDDMGDLGESKGVVLWRLDRPLHSSFLRPEMMSEAPIRTKAPMPK